MGVYTSGSGREPDTRAGIIKVDEITESHRTNQAAAPQLTPRTSQTQPLRAPRAGGGAGGCQHAAAQWDPTSARVQAPTPENPAQTRGKIQNAPRGDVSSSLPLPPFRCRRRSTARSAGRHSLRRPRRSFRLVADSGRRRGRGGQ